MASDAVSNLIAGATAKRDLRAGLRALRASLPFAKRADADAAIARRVFDLPEFRQARVVLTYLSAADEVDTRGIIREAWNRGKAVAIPRCVPGARLMEWFAIESFDGLVGSRFGIEEPDPARMRQLDVGSLARGEALAVVPALAFDAQGNRLGYGGGYYDVFLEAFAGPSAGLCRDEFLVDSLAGFVEPHDRAVDVVVTPFRALRS